MQISLACVHTISIHMQFPVTSLSGILGLPVQEWEQAQAQPEQPSEPASRHS